MNNFLTGIFVLYLAIIFFDLLLEYLNLKHLKKHGNTIPLEFEGHIDQSFLDKSIAYTIEKTNLDFFSTIFNKLMVIIFIFGGILNLYNNWIFSLKMSFIPSGLIFFLIIVYAELFFSIPFDLYTTFVIEKKYGFNTMDFKLWISDFIKSLLISTVLIGIILLAALYILQKSPEFWWFWIWLFFLIYTVFIMFISPYVIEPLFNKFTAIDNEGLKKDILNLMEKVGIKVSNIFKIDASKRTTHTNAYFTGIGKVKRIVLYDTLINNMEKNEILSVLAHEIGHWKKKHVFKRIIITEIISLIFLYVSFLATKGDRINEIFNLNNGLIYSKLLILFFIFSVLSFIFSPLFNYYSRKNEDEADDFSCELTNDSEGLARALIKLSKDNLSNLHPHPLYAGFHYSHPPVLKRIKRLKTIK